MQLNKTESESKRPNRVEGDPYPVAEVGVKLAIPNQAANTGDLPFVQ